jgi:hypothetical protein
MKLKIKDLRANTGQVKGVPKNPRYIKDEKYELLKESLVDDPEFTDLNPILVYDNADGTYIVMGGNMRTRAAKELGWKEIEASVMPNGTPPKKIRSRIIKHNADYGSDDWDLLANEWPIEELPNWGVDLPFLNDQQDINSINGSDENAEWVGMPDFEALADGYKIIIHFEDETTRADYAEVNKIPFIKKESRAWSTTYPFKERERLADYKYE